MKKCGRPLVLPLVSFPCICLPIQFIHVVAFIIPCYLFFYLSHHASSGTSASPFAFFFYPCAAVHHHLLPVFSYCRFILLPFLFSCCILVLVFTFYTSPSPPLFLLHLLCFSPSVHFVFLVIFLSSLTPPPNPLLTVLLLLELISETG